MLRLRVVSDSRLEQALDKAADYIANRQCRNGGFCYYRYADLEEPNLYDTYYAVAARGLLQREIPNPDRVVEYLRSMKTAGQQSSYLYYSIAASRLTCFAVGTKHLTRLHLVFYFKSHTICCI